MNQLISKNVTINQISMSSSDHNARAPFTEFIEHARIGRALSDQIRFVGISAEDEGIDKMRRFSHEVSRHGYPQIEGREAYEMALPWEGCPVQPAWLLQQKWDWAGSKKPILIAFFATVVGVLFFVYAWTKSWGLGPLVDIVLVWFVATSLSIRKVRIVAAIRLSLRRDCIGKSYESNNYGGDSESRIAEFEKIFAPAKADEYKLYLSMPRVAFSKIVDFPISIVASNIALHRLRSGDFSDIFREYIADSEISYAPDKIAVARLRKRGLGRGIINDLLLAGIFSAMIPILIALGALVSWLYNHTPDRMLPIIPVALAGYGFIIFAGGSVLSLIVIALQHGWGIKTSNEPLLPLKYCVEVMPAGSGKWLRFFSSEHRAVAAEVYNLVQRDIRGDPLEVMQ
jgi:hypothetical protein